MTKLTVTEAQANFSDIVERVCEGEDIIITKMGKPLVKISPCPPTPKAQLLGYMEGQAVIPDDFDTWPELEARALGIEE